VIFKVKNGVSLRRKRKRLRGFMFMMKEDLVRCIKLYFNLNRLKDYLPLLKSKC